MRDLSGVPGQNRCKLNKSVWQHSVWSLDEGSGSYIADAEMSHTADSITWTFTIPENYPFNFANVESYKVIIHDISRDLDLTRTYVIG